jgi:hypothetical protein
MHLIFHATTTSAQAIPEGLITKPTESPAEAITLNLCVRVKAANQP